MIFEEFAQKLFSELKKELPGFSAQNQMAPAGRKPTDDYLNRDISPKKSAVLILIYPGAEAPAIQIILIIRAENEKGNHSGQISFPGGGFDVSDVHLSETALREAEEEIGIDRKTITIIGELSPVYIPVSNYHVLPFVGICNQTPVFKKYTPEVSGLLEVDINEFLSDRNKTTSEIFLKSRNARMNVPCYNIGGEIIWGATAMILAEFSEMIRRIK